MLIGLESYRRCIICLKDSYCCLSRPGQRKRVIKIWETCYSLNAFNEISNRSSVWALLLKNLLFGGKRFLIIPSWRLCASRWEINPAERSMNWDQQWDVNQDLPDWTCIAWSLRECVVSGALPVSISVSEMFGNGYLEFSSCTCLLLHGFPGEMPVL